MAEPPPCFTEGCYTRPPLSNSPSNILSTTGPRHFKRPFIAPYSSFLLIFTLFFANFCVSQPFLPAPLLKNWFLGCRRFTKAIELLQTVEGSTWHLDVAARYRARSLLGFLWPLRTETLWNFSSDFVFLVFHSLPFLSSSEFFRTAWSWVSSLFVDFSFLTFLCFPYFHLFLYAKVLPCGQRGTFCWQPPPHAIVHRYVLL